MIKIKPLYVMFQDGIGQDQIAAVMSGINTVLKIAGAESLIRVVNWGVWRNDGYCANGVLQAYQSVDWYVAKGFEKSRNKNQVYVRPIMYRLMDEPWQEKNPHYEVVVLHSDIYNDGCNFVVGSAIEGFGTIVSINRFKNLERQLQAGCIKTTVMHEIGHVFGLVPKTRTINVVKSLGLHCTCQCVMRQGLSVPHDFIKYTEERLATGQVFCPRCQQDLRNYFRN